MLEERQRLYTAQRGHLTINGIMSYLYARLFKALLVAVRLDRQIRARQNTGCAISRPTSPGGSVLEAELHHQSSPPISQSLLAVRRLLAGPSRPRCCLFWEGQPMGNGGGSPSCADILLISPLQSNTQHVAQARCNCVWVIGEDKISTMRSVEGYV